MNMRFVCLVALCLIAFVPILAQEAVAPPAASPKPWTGAVTLSAVGTGGSSEALQLAFGLDLGYANDMWQNTFEADANLNSVKTDDGTQSQEQYESDLSVRRRLRGKLFGLVVGQWDHEPQAHVTDFYAGPGLGLLLLNSPRAFFIVQAGPAYSRNRTQDVDTTDWSIFLQPAARHRIGDAGYIGWKGDLKFATDEGRFTSDQEIDLATPLGRRFALQVGLEWEHDSVAVEPREKNDYVLKVGVSVNLFTQ